MRVPRAEGAVVVSVTAMPMLSAEATVAMLDGAVVVVSVSVPATAIVPAVVFSVAALPALLAETAVAMLGGAVAVVLFHAEDAITVVVFYAEAAVVVRMLRAEAAVVVRMLRAEAAVFVRMLRAEAAVPALRAPAVLVLPGGAAVRVARGIVVVRFGGVVARVPTQSITFDQILVGRGPS